MANLLTRVVPSFQGSIPVPTLNGLDSEFNQFIGASGVFTGGTNGFKILLKSSDAADPPLECDQIGAGPLAEWKQNGVLKTSIANSGQIVSAVTTGTAPFSVASTTEVANLNAASVGGTVAANIAKNTSRTFFALTFKIDDPSTFSLNDFSALPILRVPAIAGGFITRIHVVFTSGSHTSGGSLTFTVFRNGATATGFTVNLDNTNNAVNTFYTTNPTDIAIADGDSLTVELTARSGTITERAVSVNVEGYQLITI